MSILNCPDDMPNKHHSRDVRYSAFVTKHGSYKKGSSYLMTFPMKKATNLLTAGTGSEVIGSITLN